LPQPRPVSSAAALRTGQVWTSQTLGFSFEYDDRLWTVDRQNATSAELSAGGGALVVLVEGFSASKQQPKELVQSGVAGLKDVVLGLTEETDPSRLLPGTPAIGYRDGEASVLNGTLNGPQGPSNDVSVVVLAATQAQVSLRVTIVANDATRTQAFQVADSLLNHIEWPGGAQ
jgi:hypothetical protein